MFGVGLDPDTVAWFQATSPVDGLTGFFLFLDIPLPSSFFDGADLPVPATSIVFTQVSVESGNATELNIVNPGTAIANLQLELMRPGSLPISKSLSLPVHGVVRLDVATFFGVSEAPAGTYVGVSSNVEIAGFELVSAPDGDLVGLNARSTNEQLTHLYFPQLAVLGPFETTLGVVNNSNQAVILTVTAFKPEGSLYDTANLQRNPVTRSLNPGESLVEDVESMFGFSGGETLDGWLQVESTSESVTGFITYGTPLTGASATVTPARVGQTRAIFSHIATVTDFFTGVAVLNAGQLAANVRVLAITPAGQILGSFDSVLQPGQRISKLIHELIPEAIGQSGGLIWVKSDLPVHLTSLFGSTAVLANIPPQAAPEAYEPDAGLQTVRVSPSLAIVQPQNTQSFTVNASGQNIVWKVNGVAGGDPAAGIISATGSYTAPSEVPSPQVVTVSAEVDNNTAGASVDVLEKTELFASQRIIQSVAYLGSLERIYTAELAILNPTSTSYPLLALAPSQLVGDSEIFEVPNPGAAKQLLTTLVGEIISKMISYTATTGKEFLLLAGQTTGRVIRLDPTTLETVDVAVGLNSPSSLVIDPNSGDLLVAEQDEVTSIPRADVEAGLAISPSALEARVSDFPQAITQIQASGADGVTVDRCTGNVYTSDTQLGVIRELNALTGELQVLVSGLQAPGQLLALYRANVGCPDSVELLVVEAGADQVTLTVPREGLVAPWIPATDSTDLSFLPEGTPFAFGSSVLLPEFVGGEQPQQGGDRYSLRSIGLQQHRRQPSNPESKPPETKPTTPEPITPEDDTLIPQNDATIDCPPDSASGFGFQIRFSWTPSSSPAGEVRYRLRVKNKGAPRPLLDTTVENPEFTLRACNEVVTTENLEDWEWQVLAVDTLDNFSDPSGIGSFEFEECLLDDTVPCLSGSDLSVTKSGSPNPTVPEGPLTYTLEVRNRGPAAASDVVLNDQLPFRVSFQSVTSSQGSCLESNGSVACRLGTLTAGASATVKIFVLVRASAAGATIVNSALVLAAQDDPDYSNNRVEVETKVLKGTELQADLSLTKSDSPDRVEPGQQLIYSLSIQNNGPSPATGVRLSDKLPSGLTFSSVASSQGECEESKGSVSCELEEMPPGSSAEVRIAVRVTTSDESVTNVASVKANEDDPDGDNNTAKEETEIVGISPLGTNLALIKSDNKDPVEPGSTLIYSLTVDNEGPDDAVDVILTDELPPLVTFLAAEASQGLCSESKGMVTCKLGVLPRGEAVKTEIAVNIGAAAAGTVLINTAAVGADQEDLNNDDNVARETTTVLRGTVFGSDVYVEKQDSKDPVEAEERFAYLLTVGNAGPGPASGVTLTDELPPELIFIAGKSSQGECNESSGTVRCELGSLARGESAEVVVSVQVDPSSPATRVLNHASVGATETDPNQSNNEAEEETSLLGPLAPEADVSLSKRASPNPVQAGSSLSYKLTVRNAGPDPASQVKLVDSLPAEVSFVVVESSQGGCSHSSGEVGCDLGNLPAGSSASVAISVTVSQEAVGILRNRAVAGAAEDDPNPGNNAGATETTVLGGNGLQAADLSVSKSASPDPVEAGGSLTYRITIRNGGPDKANGVEVSDSFPSDVSFVSAGASQGKCSHSQGRVGCDLGTLDVGASASVSINVDVGKSARGSIGNTASAGASEPDPNPSNNSDKTTTEVTEPPPVADIAVGKSASGTVEAGKSLTYRITVRNSGPDKASGVELRDSLPSDVSFVSAGASQGKCSHSQGKVGCDLGTLDVGATASVSINVDVSTSARGSISNTASAGSAEVDPDTSNNSDTTTTEITEPPSVADIRVSKSAPDLVKAGGSLTYRITVSNSKGPDKATGVEVHDSLPSEVSFVSVDESQGRCSESKGDVDCDLGTLAVGASASVSIGVVVSPLARGSISNSARADASEVDPQPSNNSDKKTTTIQ